jgi:hypothetical protein
VGYVIGALIAVFLFCSSLATGAHASAGVLRTGTMSTVAGAAKECPSGMRCEVVEVSCPDVRAAARGELATIEPTGPLKGIVVFFSGSDGTMWWTDRGEPASAFLFDLGRRGYRAIQVRWQTPWMRAADGERAGPALLACRPATVISSVYERSAIPDHPDGSCGFCISGQSGGASQIAYALSRYGLDKIVDVAVASSGPIHADIEGGCSGGPGLATFNTKNQASIFDASYGFGQQGGPCQHRDRSWAGRWREDSLETSGVFRLDRTTIRFVFGGGDDTPAALHAIHYIDRLDRGGTRFGIRILPCLGHGLTGMDEGVAAVGEALGITAAAHGAAGGRECQTRKFVAPLQARYGDRFESDMRRGSVTSSRGRDHGAGERSKGIWTPWLAIPFILGVAGGAAFLGWLRRAHGTETSAPSKVAPEPEHAARGTTE